MNDNTDRSSLTTTKRVPASIGLAPGQKVPGLEGMVYLCTSLTHAFHLRPFESRLAFDFLLDDKGEIFRVYPESPNEIYVHVAVSELEYKKTCQDLAAEEAKERKVRGVTKEVAKSVPFHSSQVVPEILSKLPPEAWLSKKKGDTNDETRPSKHATNAPLSETLRKAGFSSLAEVKADVASKAPKLLLAKKFTPEPRLPEEFHESQVENFRSNLEDKKRLRDERKQKREQARTDRFTQAMALNANRAPQPNGSLADSKVPGEKVLLIDIQSSLIGHLDIKNAELPGMQVCLNFPKQYWLVEKMWNGVLWFCLQSNPRFGLPAQEWWDLSTSGSQSPKVVITE